MPAPGNLKLEFPPYGDKIQSCPVPNGWEARIFREVVGGGVMDDPDDETYQPFASYALETVERGLMTCCSIYYVNTLNSNFEPPYVIDFYVMLGSELAIEPYANGQLTMPGKQSTGLLCNISGLPFSAIQIWAKLNNRPVTDRLHWELRLMLVNSCGGVPSTVFGSRVIAGP